MADAIRVRICVAHADRQLQRMLELPARSCVADAIRASGILHDLPGFEPAGVGIFGRAVTAQTVLRDGDRVELYRALQIDPKDARRRRAGR